MIRSNATRMHGDPTIPNSKPTRPALSQEEQQGRRKAVETARRSNQLSGFEPEPAVEALNARYIVGELTSDELTAAIQRLVLTLAAAGGPAPVP